MNLLLDTHVLISILDREPERFGGAVEDVLSRNGVILFVSVVSIWEIALKFQLGKLVLEQQPDEIAEAVRRLGIAVLPITDIHVVTSCSPEPATRDPFDRLLLSVCRSEEFLLLTADRALTSHPLAYRG